MHFVLPVGLHARTQRKTARQGQALAGGGKWPPALTRRRRVHSGSHVGSEGKSDSPVSPKEKMGSTAAPVARLVTSKQPAAGRCPAIRSTARNCYLIHGSDALGAVAQRGRVYCRPCRMLGFTMHGESRPRRATVLDQPCDATGCTGLMREV